MDWRSIKSSIFEEESESAIKTTAPVQAAVPPPPPPQPVAVVSTGETLDTDVYQRLASETDWANTQVFQAIKKHLAPLEGMQIDPKTKFTVALKQASAMDNIDPSAVTQVFEDAKNYLNKKLNDLKQAVINKTATDVEAKNKQADDLIQQANQLKEEAFQNQQRIQSQQHKFEVAVAQRLSELTQKQTEYNSLLS